MPPIPLHIEDSITPSKASGVTPSTQADTIPGSINSDVTTSSAPTTTTASGYPPARPGAVASLPAPTQAVPKPQLQPTRTYTPAEATDLPAPPQPGALPSLNYNSNSSSNSTAFQTNATGIPPPHPQSDYSAPSPYNSRTVNLGPATSPAAVHPLGYQQNAYAQELNSQQRASLDMQERREKGESGTFGSLATPQTAEVAENAWEAVKSWGSSIGEAATKAHVEAWKWIDGKN